MMIMSGFCSLLTRKVCIFGRGISKNHCKRSRKILQRKTHPVEMAMDYLESFVQVFSQQQCESYINTSFNYFIVLLWLCLHIPLFSLSLPRTPCLHRIELFDASLCGVSVAPEALHRFFTHSLTHTLTFKPRLTGKINHICGHWRCSSNSVNHFLSQCYEPCINMVR